MDDLVTLGSEGVIHDIAKENWTCPPKPRKNDKAVKHRRAPP
jgi:hypothetical protein